jgi:hypothetical protein
MVIWICRVAEGTKERTRGRKKYKKQWRAKIGDAHACCSEEGVDNDTDVDWAL